MPTAFKFGDEHSRHLSDFEAHKIITQIPEEEKQKPCKYELLRTGKGVIYQENRKRRTKQSFKIKRMCALLAKQNKDNVLYDEKKGFIYTKDVIYVIADNVKTKEEEAYHINKVGEYDRIDEPVKVISLAKSSISPYFEMDTKTIRDYYKDKFHFPDWFKPFVKQRAFRVMNLNNSFAFSSRRYNDTSKWTAEQKLVNDLIRQNKCGDAGKIYFTLARMLDNKLDRKGEGFPIKDLVLLVLDVDGKCNGTHEINENGICIKCMKNAFKKEKKVKQILLDSNYPYPIKTLFSGGKGLHLHFGLEVTQDKIKEIIDYVNKDEELVDCFKDKEGKFDTYRIFKVPNTISAETACIIEEELIRLNVQDKICEPFGQ